MQLHVTHIFAALKISPTKNAAPSSIRTTTSRLHFFKQTLANSPRELQNTAKMGRVRTKTVKKSAKVIIERFYPKLTLDFETNKRLCDEIAIIASKRLRNKVRGQQALSHQFPGAQDACMRKFPYLT